MYRSHFGSSLPAKDPIRSISEMRPKDDCKKVLCTGAVKDPIRSISEMRPKDDCMKVLCTGATLSPPLDPITMFIVIGLFSGKMMRAMVQSWSNRVCEEVFAAIKRSLDPFTQWIPIDDITAIELARTYRQVFIEGRLGEFFKIPKGRKFMPAMRFIVEQVGNWKKLWSPDSPSDYPREGAIIFKEKGGKVWWRVYSRAWVQFVLFRKSTV